MSFPVAVISGVTVFVGIMAPLALQGQMSRARRILFPRRYLLRANVTLVEKEVSGIYFYGSGFAKFTAPLEEFATKLGKKFRLPTIQEAEMFYAEYGEPQNFKLLASESSAAIVGKTIGFDPGPYSMELMIPTGTALLVVRM